MKKYWVLVVLALVLVFGGIFGGKYYFDQRAAFQAAHQPYPPISVAAVAAQKQTWEPQVSALGSLRAVAGTEITAQIAGNVVQVAFRSGARVHQGDLLVRLDDSSQLATLHADQAKLQLARATLARTRKLYAAHAASQSDLQQAQADYGTAAAVLEGDQAVLQKLHIVAPFDGVVGIREVSLGQYVSPGTAIVNLQNDDPLYLDFTLPQGRLSEVKAGLSVTFTTDAYAGQTFTGTVTAIGSQVDPQTRNFSVQATLKNADGRLRPGLYGSARLSLGQPMEGLVLPDTAVTYNTFGDSVYVVTGDAPSQTVRIQAVQVGDERDGRVLILSGIAEGDQVVTGGQNKLRDGAVVAVSSAAKP